MNFLHKDAAVWENDDTYKTGIGIVQNIRI